MNHIILIVRIINNPKQSFFDNNIVLTEIIGKFYQFKKNSYNRCKLLIWGNLAYDSIKYYHMDDYLIIEGSISVNKTSLEGFKELTEIEIAVSKIYPFILKSILFNKINK